MATNTLPGRLRLVLWLQLGLALLILLFGWSETVASRVGRTPSFADVVALTAPLLLVIAAVILSNGYARRGALPTATLIAWSPLPLALVLAALAGMV